MSIKQVNERLNLKQRKIYARVRRLIKKHEKTRKDKEDDRTRHIEVLAANDEPVFLAYRAQAALTDLQNKVMATPPAYDFTSADGVGHTTLIRGRALKLRHLGAHNELL